MKWSEEVYRLMVHNEKKRKQKIHIMGIPEEKEKNDKKVYLKQND